MKNRLMTLLLLMTAGIVSALANDGTYYTCGNQLIPLTETDISVKKEILTISLQDDDMAKVDVYYEFYNPGKSDKTVTMGFEADPPYNDEYKFYASGKHPHIKDFTVEANGKKLAYKNAVCQMEQGQMKQGFLDVSKYRYNEEFDQLVKKSAKSNEEGIAFAYVYYFKMNFKPGKNIVHHTYAYRMSVVVGTDYLVDYKLSPAARWANRQIDDFTLVIRADNTAKHFTVAQNVFGKATFKVTEGTGKIRLTSDYDIPYHEFSLRNGAVTLHKKNFRPNSDQELSIQAADQIYSFKENTRLGDYYDRSYYSVGLCTMNAEQYTKQSLSADMQKRILKNLPFANRGHVFKDAALKKYFTSLWWYMPDASYKDDTSGFTKVDWEYVNAGK